MLYFVLNAELQNNKKTPQTASSHRDESVLDESFPLILRKKIPKYVSIPGFFMSYLKRKIFTPKLQSTKKISILCAEQGEKHP